VCTAVLRFENGGEELSWATASRHRTGGFRVHVPAGDVASDDIFGIGCRAAGCTIAGAADDNDGQGGTQDSGTTLAWRGLDGHFVHQHPVNPAGTDDSGLTRVSCTRGGFCAALVAVGGGVSIPKGEPPVLVRATAHGRWTVPPDSASGQLYSVSCPSASFCVALGSTAGAERWDGHGWSGLAAPDRLDPSGGGLAAVTCRSATFCLATGSTKGGHQRALAATWNGTGWTVRHPATPAGSIFSELDAVSCPSVTHCVAVGAYAVKGGSQRALVETWNGTSWRIAAPHLRVPDAGFPARTSVSCPAASACMATWSDFGTSVALWWNGKKWAGTTFAGPRGRSFVREFDGMTCASPVSCTAVGFFLYPSSSGPLVEHWNGRAWSLQTVARPAIGTPQFASVSCPAGTACTAVGSNARARLVPFAETRG
jgi:hypothetical protein